MTSLIQPSLYPATGRHVEVAIPVPVTEIFTYSIASEYERLPVRGGRVRVRFAGRQLTGVVLRVFDGAPPGLDPRRIREVEDVLDAAPVVIEPLLELATRVAEAYVVGVGEVLAACLPAGGDQVGGRRVRRLAGTAAPVAAAVALHEGLSADCETSAHQLEKRFRGTPVHANLLLLRDAGLVEIADESGGGAPGARQVLVRWAGLSVDEAGELTRRAPRQAAVLQPLREQAQEWQPERELIARLGVSRAIMVGLSKKGVIRRESDVRPEAALPSLPADGAGTFDLTADQETALEILIERLDGGDPRPVLLHGITGSGKTEVYLRAAAEAVRRDRGVLLLVPEIGLTPQLERRARAVLGKQVLVLHSGMSTGARARAWWRLRSGLARVVVGPRSAAFSPVERVGLVVLDEEQDSAYKQAERPRYHGREVALWRAEIEGAAAVMGSATPAIESFRAASEGTWQLATMPARVGTRELPATELVDMRTEWSEVGRSLVSRRLEDGLAQRAERGEQALVMLNRRGFASAIVCRVCGDRGECPNCAVSLTYHRQAGVLMCHYCGERQRVPKLCAQCGATALHDVGQGTQRLQEALEKRFPGARIQRFDADQTQRRGAHARILASFARGEIDILVGTQMLAKGHDFPSVTLVGVVAADASLGVPDFRAGERTFQLLTQVAGRAGRGDLPGEVILQAHQPDHYAIETALAHDYGAFYDREIEFRRRLAYPPFSALALCVCRGKVATDVRRDADNLAQALRDTSGSTARILGPAQPLIARLRGKYRLQVLIKTRTRAELPPVLSEALARLNDARRMPRDLVVDVGPDSML